MIELHQTGVAEFIMLHKVTRMLVIVMRENKRSMDQKNILEN